MGGGGYKVHSFKVLKQKQKADEAHGLLLRIAAQVCGEKKSRYGTSPASPYLCTLQQIPC